jgi:hypothetical protein
MAAFAVARVRFLGGLEDLVNVGWAHVGTPPPAGIVPQAEHGYDGQYFLRLALEPLPSTVERYGLVFDEPAYRAQRVGYPALAWLVTVLTPAGAPLALLLVNLAGVGALALLGARLARRLGRPPVLGGALAVNPVTVQAVARDTAEVVALVLVVSAVLLLLDQRLAAAGLALLGAALTRETTLLVVAGLGVAVLVGMTRARRLPSAGECLLVGVPALAWVAWQLYELSVWGTLPVGAGDSRIGPPLAGLRIAVADAVATGPDLRDAAWLLGPLAVVVLLAAAQLRSSAAPLGLKVGHLLSLALLLCLTRAVWVVPAGWMRAGLEVMVLSVVVLWAAPGRRSGLVSAGTAGLLVGCAVGTMPAFLLLQHGT